MTTLAEVTKPAGLPLKISLWLAQSIVFAVFCAAGFSKLTMPIPQLSAMMAWTGQLPETFVRSIGIIDLAGGLGIMLPFVTRIQPRLGVLAALGCTILQILASAFHASRGEFAVLPLNLVLLLCSAFVFWGRRTMAPIASR